MSDDPTTTAGRRMKPPFWLLMLAHMSRRHAEFLSTVRSARRRGFKIRPLPRQQIMRAWADRRRKRDEGGNEP